MESRSNDDVHLDQELDVIKTELVDEAIITKEPVKKLKPNKYPLCMKN